MVSGAIPARRACESELAEIIDAARIPNLKELRALFTPDGSAAPQGTIALASLDSYNELANVVAPTPVFVDTSLAAGGQP